MRQTLTRTTAALLALFIALSCVAGSVLALEWDGTEGSRPKMVDGTYQIGTAAELSWFAEAVNAGNSGIHAALTDDIDLNRADWTPIGNTEFSYQGTFDGQGHTIENLEITASSAYQALFGYIGEGGIVQDLKLTGSVTASAGFIGGIAGRNDGTIRNCRNYADVTYTGTSISHYHGGITGQQGAAGSVINCYNAGNISGTKPGGIIGYQAGGIAAGCCNDGTITSAGGTLATSAGGVVGQLYAGSVYNSVNAGTVIAQSEQAYGNYYVGGIAGQTTTNAKYLFNCLNIGTVTDTSGLSSHFGKICANLGNLTASDNYYLADTTDFSVGAVSEADLKTAAFMERLNANDGTDYGFVLEEDMLYTAVSDAYPTLAWLSDGTDAVDVLPVEQVIITGTAKEGETLTAYAVSALGEPAAGVTYQWQASADGNVFEDIEGYEADFEIPDDSSYAGLKLRVAAVGEGDSAAVSGTVGPVEKSDRRIVEEAAEIFTLDTDSEIREAGQLTLPTTAGDGIAIQWSSSNTQVISKDGAVTLPEQDIVNVTLTATLKLGEAKAEKPFFFAVYSTAYISEQAYVDAAVQALEHNWFRLNPVYGEDSNVIMMVSDALEQYGYGETAVRITDPGDTNYIGDDGEITWFYANPNESRFVWFGTPQITFSIEKGDAAAIYQKQATIYWDVQKVQTVMAEEIADQITEDAVKGENKSLDAVTENLVLPKVVDHKRWTLVSWESSSDAVYVDDSAQGSADTLFDPYIGVVKRGDTDQEVTLTAVFCFQRTATGENAITLTKTFTVTVAALEDDSIRQEMQRALDENYTTDKLTGFTSGEILDTNAVTEDIQLLTPHNTGIASYDDYTFTVISDNEDAAQCYYYRVYIYRPLPGNSPETVTLTVMMAHKNYDIQVTKDISMTVLPLVQEEIDREIQLMEAVKDGYFDGLNNGANKDADAVTRNLSAFQSAGWGTDGDIQWSYSGQNSAGSITPVSIDETHPSEQWDKFHSSAPTVITHENLLVTQPEYDTDVIITSCLSSSTYARYAEKYPHNMDFAKLYRQDVSVAVTVPGTEGGAQDGGTPEVISGTFTLMGGAVNGNDGSFTSLAWLDAAGYEAEAGESVLDVFDRVLTQNGYSYAGRDYVSSVTTPGGLTLAQGGYGVYSGWMYSVNGILGDTYAGAYILEDGDEILWFYTDDYRNIDENGTITIEPDVPLPDYTAWWQSFRKSSDNNAVIEAETAVSPDGAEMLWVSELKDPNDWMTAVSEPLVIEDRIYVAVGNALYVLDENGNITAKADLLNSIDSTCRPVYAEGKVVIPLPAGQMQAVAADSLKTVWVSEALPDHEGDIHQSVSTVTYADGYLYMGTACADWSASYYGTLLCVEALTGNIVWSYTNPAAGYYWSGAVVVNGAVIFGGDDGKVLSLDAKNGGEIDIVLLDASIRSTVVSAGDSVYLTTADGVLHSFDVQADGALTNHRSVSFGAGSTGTPAIYGGKAFVGGHLGSEYGYQGVLAEIDLTDMSVTNTVFAEAEVKSAPLVSVQDGGIYVYFTANTTPGALYGYQSGADGAEILYIPDPVYQNYCMASVIADENGVLYYTNDSGAMFAVSSAGSTVERPEESPGEVTSGSTPSGERSKDKDSTSLATNDDTSPSTGDGLRLFLAVLSGISITGILLISCRRRCCD